MECEGEVQKVLVQIQGHSIHVLAYILPIAAVELVFGTQWLATLDTHLANYRQCFLTFYVNGEQITLQRNSSNLPSLAQFHQLKRLQAIDAIVELYTIQIQTPEVPTQHLLELPASMEP